jgi:hypothetical protein
MKLLEEYRNQPQSMGNNKFINQQGSLILMFVSTYLFLNPLMEFDLLQFFTYMHKE